MFHGVHVHVVTKNRVTLVMCAGRFDLRHRGIRRTLADCSS
jgi:hypothetical protein